MSMLMALTLTYPTDFSLCLCVRAGAVVAIVTVSNRILRFLAVSRVVCCGCRVSGLHIHCSSTAFPFFLFVMCVMRVICIFLQMYSASENIGTPETSIVFTNLTEWLLCCNGFVG